MRWTPLVCALILWGCAPEPPTESSPADQEPAQPLTVVLEGGMLYSGDDQPPVRADVGLREDRIAAIGDLGEVPGELRLDVTGLAVAPGFVDIHSHALRNNPDRSGIYRWPDAENLIRQGVTSIIGGPDGTSPLPIADDLAALEAAPASVNFGTFVGQGSIRQRVVGSEDRPATAEELEAMRAEVAAAMRAGAFGLSTGLIYAPGSFASTEEIIGLARVVADYGGIYITHMRNEAGGVFDSIAETIRIGEEGGLPVQITHHKVIGGAMWGRSVDTLALVDAAIARGIDISIDQYPYTASSTDLTAVFPRWSLSGDAVARRARMDDPGERTRMRQAIMELLANERGGDDPPTDTVLADCSWDPDLNGLNLAQVLERRSRTVTLGNAAELVMELQYAGGCSVVYHTMSEDDVERIMLYPGTMVASEGGIMIPGEGVPHPRKLRRVCAGSGGIRERTGRVAAPHGHPQDDPASGRADRSGRSGATRRRCSRGYRRVRCGRGRGPPNVCGPAPLRRGRPSRLRGRTGRSARRPDDWGATRTGSAIDRRLGGPGARRR